MQLEFSDKTIKKYVANHPYGYLVVIETDHLNAGLQANIYKDTVSSLGGIHIKEIRNMPNLIEAKKRAQNAMDAIISNEKGL